MPAFQSTRRRVAAGFACGLLAAFTPTVFAQGRFPSKPVNLVVPFAAGGGLDVTARIIAERLREELGQPVIIMNRPGAGSAVGARVVASAPPDGHTLFITSGSAFGFLHMLVPNMDLRLDNFVPVASVAINPSVIVGSSQLPVRSLAELGAFAKPEQISFCSAGAGGLNHLQLEMFRRVVKSKSGKDFSVTHVPYNGVAPALTGLRDGSVQACMLPYTGLVKNMHGKTLQVLAVQSKDRLRWLPGVPTTGEQGFPELDTNDAFINIAAPKGTPPAVIAKLENALQKTMQDPEVVRKLEDMEVQPVFKNSSQTQQWLEEDVRKFSSIIREAGLVAK